MTMVTCVGQSAVHVGHVLCKQYGFAPANCLCQCFPLLFCIYMNGSKRNKHQPVV